MKKSELKQLIKEVLSEGVMENIETIVGKTIKSVDKSERGVTIDFTDGKSIAIFVDGHDDSIDYMIHP